MKSQASKYITGKKALSHQRIPMVEFQDNNIF